MAWLDADIIADESEPGAVSRADQTPQKECVLQRLDNASKATSSIPPRFEGVNVGLI